MNSIYIGFDGGGSQSRFLIKRGLEEPYECSYPINLKYSDIGINKSARGFAKSLREILGEDVILLKAICISLSGASSESMNKEFAHALRKEIGIVNLIIHIESDSSFTLATAYPNDESGMLLIAGTGSVAIAKKRNGEIVKVGGWGRLLGDGGSGYWIGLQALKSFCRQIDEEDKSGKLFKAIQKKLFTLIGDDTTLLRNKLYKGELLPQEYAELTFEYITNDVNAENIILHAAELLFETVATLHHKVSKDCEPLLILHGSVARQPVMYEYLKINLAQFGVLCKILDTKAPLKNALRVAESMVE